MPALLGANAPPLPLAELDDAGGILEWCASVGCSAADAWLPESTGSVSELGELLLDDTVTGCTAMAFLYAASVAAMTSSIV